MWKITGKAVLDNLNCKIFFISQPWWQTGFLGIYQLTAWNLKWLPKSGIIRLQWPLGFKMHFKCCNFISLQPLTVYMENSLKFEMSHLHQVTFIFLRPCERCYGSYLTSWNFTPKWNLKPVWVHFWSHVKMLLKFENSEANEHGYLKTNERSKL